EDGIRDYKVTGVQTCAFRSLVSHSEFRTASQLQRQSMRPSAHQARRCERFEKALWQSRPTVVVRCRGCEPGCRCRWSDEDHREEIGRASCRERVYSWVGAVS